MKGIIQMKRFFTLLITAILCASCVACSGNADETTSAEDTSDVTSAQTEAAETEPDEAATTYYVGTPYGEKDARFPDTYEDLKAAEKVAKENERFGMVVCNDKGEIVYCPTSSVNAAKIVFKAKEVADYMRDNGYTYGHAAINPAIAKGQPDCEKLASCDRFVGWAMYEAGFVRRQPELHGLISMDNFWEYYGFTKITDMDELMPGDLICVGDPDGTDSYTHIFLYAGKAGRTNTYRYDAGSTDRIACVGAYASYHESGQPFCQPLELSSSAMFKFAQRPPVKDIG